MDTDGENCADSLCGQLESPHAQRFHPLFVRLRRINF